MAEVKAEDIRIILQDPEAPNEQVGQDPNIQVYDPYKVPADLDLARKHGKAKMVYVPKHAKKHEEHGREACLCCGLPVEGEPIPLNAGLDKLYHLGSGFALYFKFIKYSIGILILLFVATGLYNILSNVMEGDCSDGVVTGDEYCVKGYILSFTLPNKRDNDTLLTTQLALNLVSIIIVMLFFHFLRYQFRKTEIEADDKTITPADYTIVIENMPPEATKDEIEEWIQDFATEEMPLNIERIIRPYDIHIYIQLVNKNNALIKTKTSLRRKDGTYHAKDEARVRGLEAQIKATQNKLEEFKKNGLQKCSLVYVTFAKAHQANHVQSKFKRSLLAEMLAYVLSKVVNTSNLFQGTRVKVTRAPEPTDIMWENLGYTKRERRTSRFITAVITVILILGSFGLIILVNWGQVEASKNLGEDSIFVQILSIIASLVIVITNTMLSMTIDFLARYEKHFTYTYYLKGVAEKLAVAQFFNTALTNLLAELILADVNENNGNRLQAINFYGKGGLLEGMYWVFITNAFLTPAMTIFDPSYIMKRVMQYLVSEKGLFPKMTQKEVNQLYEGPAITMPAKYATMIKMVLITAFYAPALPFVLIFTIVGLALCYWTEKYVLLRRNSLPNSIDDGLADSMVELLEWATCTFAVGNIIYSATLRNSDGDIAFTLKSANMIWVGLGISLFHIIFPMELLNKKLFPIKDEVTETQTYEEVRVEFSTDYDIENPLTRRKALRAHINRLRKGANDNQRLAFLKKLDHGDFGRMNLQDLQQATVTYNKRDHVTNFSRGIQARGDDDNIDFEYLDSYAKQLEDQGSKIDQGAGAGVVVNANPEQAVDNPLKLGKVFGSFVQSTPDNTQKAGFPTVVDRTPGDTLGVNWHPNQGPKLQTPGPLSPNGSSMKLNNESNAENLGDKELENIVSGLFNVSSPATGASERRNLEMKMNPFFVRPPFGNQAEGEKNTEAKPENQAEGSPMQVIALAGIQRKSIVMMTEQEKEKEKELEKKKEKEKEKEEKKKEKEEKKKEKEREKEEKKKEKEKEKEEKKKEKEKKDKDRKKSPKKSASNDDSANIGTSECIEDSERTARSMKVARTLSISQRR